MRLAKIAGYIIDVVRHYSIDSHTRDLASRARDPRKAQPARQAFSFSSENPFSLGGDSWQSARGIAETSWRALLEETPSTLPSLCSESRNFTSRFSVAKYAHVAIGHRSSYESHDHVFLYVTEIMGKRTIAFFRKRTTGHSNIKRVVLQSPKLLHGR